MPSMAGVIVHNVIMEGVKHLLSPKAVMLLLRPRLLHLPFYGVWQVSFTG
jgi:hypothetical protein